MVEREGVTALYCRRSKQGRDVIDTVDSQEAELRGYASDHGWDNVRLFRERGASAGPKLDRTRKVFYGELVPAIDKGEVVRILAVEADRLSRYQLSFWTFLEACKVQGTEVILTRSGTNATDPRTSILELAIRSGLASEESRIRSDRQTSHRGRMRDAGRQRSGGFRKYGYEPDNQTPRPAEIALIRESAQMILNGNSLRAVTLKWWDAGILNAHGKRPHPTSIRRCLLRSDLLDAGTREQLAVIFSDPKRKRGGFSRRRYLLSGGIAVCDECTAPLVSYPKSKTVREYRCMTRTSEQVVGCGAVRRDALEIEREVLTIMRGTGLSQGKIEAQLGPDEGTDIAAIAGERAALEARLDSVADAFADETLTKEQAHRANERILGKLTELDERARVVATDDTNQRRREVAWGKLIENVDLDDPATFDFYRGLIEATVERVTVPPQGAPMVWFNDVMIVRGDA
jgi:DNA invertase Pin-like site-specific DNA recombinase